MAIRYGWLTPPSKPVFIISAVLAVLVWLGVLRVPLVQANLFETLLIAYAVLLAGNLMRGA